MIDMTCPECGDEAEIDPVDLGPNVEIIECEECGAEFEFTRKDGQIVLGTVIQPGTCQGCGLTCSECTCDPDEDDDTEIEEIEDEDGDA